jgi:hypothetical protein
MTEALQKAKTAGICCLFGRCDRFKKCCRGVLHSDNNFVRLPPLFNGHMSGFSPRKTGAFAVAADQSSAGVSSPPSPSHAKGRSDADAAA